MLSRVYLGYYVSTAQYRKFQDNTEAYRQYSGVCWRWAVLCVAISPERENETERASGDLRSRAQRSGHSERLLDSIALFVSPCDSVAVLQLLHVVACAQHSSSWWIAASRLSYVRMLPNYLTTACRRRNSPERRPSSQKSIAWPRHQCQHRTIKQPKKILRVKRDIMKRSTSVLSSSAAQEAHEHILRKTRSRGTGEDNDICS